MAKFLGLRGKALRAALIWAVVMPSYILFGYNNAVGGGLLSLPSWVETFPEIDTVNTTGDTQKHNSTIQGTVMAIYTLGCFFGGINCIWLGDRLGRKRTIMLGALINTIGAVLQSSAFSLGQLTVGRLVSGIGYGHLSATAPNWQAECVGASHRGAAVMLEGLFISAGLAIAAWVGLGLSFVPGSVSWRFPLALSLLWSLIILATTPFVPESPRWLVKVGRNDEAKEVLAALEDTEATSEEVEKKVQSIEASLHLAGQAKLSDLFHPSPLRLLHRTCLAAVVQVFMQMTGVNALSFYQATIFEQNLGLSGTISRIMAASVFTWQTMCSPLGVFTVDRFGRRKLMMFSAIGMGVCLAITAGTASQIQNTSSTAAAAAFIFMFCFFFPIGFLGLPFLYAAEVSPLAYRVPITAISTGTSWLFNFIVAEVTPIGFSTIGYRYFVVYAAINLFLTLPCVYLFFPETSGRDLEEVDQIFLKTKSIFDPVSIAQTMPSNEPAKQEHEGDSSEKC
ncbi:putative MFS sugar transporter [Thozetella sp. PMI_491]|nr:putative MFS sugar transporter [Thozetella sp. PMI_491]